MGKMKVVMYMGLSALLKQIDALKRKIVDRRPLTPEEVRELDQYYKIGTTYASNALEGNSLTLTETKVLLEDGITVGGKPIRDCYEATGHAVAYDYMLSVARGGDLELTEDVLKRLHYLFYQGIDNIRAGQYRDHQGFISGTEYLPPTPDEVPAYMAEYVAEFRGKQTKLHPVLLAAWAHRRLVDIHPYTDGNGRTARLVMNLVLVNKGYCLVSIPPVLRHSYISALQAAQREEAPTDTPFQTLIAECELEAQRDYCRMFRIPIKDAPGPE